MKIDNWYILLMPKRDIMKISSPKGYTTRRPLSQEMKPQRSRCNSPQWHCKTIYMYGTRQTCEFPHGTLAAMGFSFYMANTIDQHDSNHILKNETYPVLRGLASCIPESPNIRFLSFGNKNTSGNRLELYNFIREGISCIISFKAYLKLAIWQYDRFSKWPT